jgi:translation initiation factor 3 subunit A
MDTSYAPYLPLLQRALLSRLISQLAQVYSSITIENLLALLQPLRDALADGGGDSTIYKPEQIEAYIMRVTRAGELNVRIDHASGTLQFVDDPFAGSDDQHTSPSSHGIVVQPSAASLVRTRLGGIAGALNHALAILDPFPVPSAEEQRARIAALITAADAERKALQLRRAIVARRRELLSELAARKEKEEQSRRSEESRQVKFDEARRALEDARRREIERARAEIQQRKNEEARQLAQSLRERGNLKVDIDVSPSTFEFTCYLVVTFDILCRRMLKTSILTTLCGFKLSSSRRRRRNVNLGYASSPSGLTTPSVHTARRSARF